MSGHEKGFSRRQLLEMCWKCPASRLSGAPLRPATRRTLTFSFRKSLAALAGLALVVGLVALFTPAGTQGQGKSGGAPPARDVIVVNTPLPVTGTVSVSNLGSEPLPVRDVDNPARQPFQANIIEVPPQIPNPILFTVPAGKRLVIEYQGLAGAAGVVVTCVGLGLLYLNSRRNLWPNVVCHGLNDTVGFTTIYFGALS